LNWQQLYFEIEKSYADPISDALSELGAHAVSFEDAKDQPILEPGVGETPLWNQVTVIGLFEEGWDLNFVLAELDRQFPKKFKWLKTSPLQDQNWERAWMDGFEAIQFGKNLWVCPSWQSPPDPDAINLMLDPGLAFGSGTHETTALCLRWLEQCPLEQQFVIDYGCGSGILGIAALKLGAKKVLGFDNDEQAILASRENAIRNQINDQQLQLHRVDVNGNPSIQPCDILIANILAAPLRTLAPLFSTSVKSGGKIGLSGILKGQAEELINIYSTWFNMNPVEQDHEWCFLSGTKI